MALRTNIVRRGATYYARVTVPADLQAHMMTSRGTPMREVWKSLHTKEPAEAKRRAGRVLEKIEAEFAAKRREVKLAAELTKDDLQDIAHTSYTAAVEADERLRRNPPTDSDLSAIWRELERTHDADDLAKFRIFELVRQAVENAREYRVQRAAELKEDVGRYATAGVAPAVADIVADRRLRVDPLSDGWKDIANAVQRGELEALKRAAERDEGEYGGAVRDPLVMPPAIQKARRGETIMEMFEAYARENPRGITADTINQSRMAVELFVSTLPPRSSVKAITRGACAEWKRLLLLYPVKAAETKEFRGKPMREIVERNKVVGKPAITARTVNRYLSSLGAFCDWLLAHDYIQASPLSRMQLTVKKGDGKPFPLDDLPKIFASPLFTGAESAETIRRPGQHMIRDYRYWIPLVMLYSGARPGELAQLLVEDVREVHGRWIMHITTENDDEKTVKTAGSMRVVPLHAELERLGFLAYVDALRARGERRVFPDAKRNERQWVPDLSREFSRLLIDIGVKTKDGPSSKLSLYSFRHTVSDALRRAGFDDLEFAPLYGHGKATTTGRYGNEKPRTIEQRAAMIDAIAYEGLDLSHLCRAL